jgi:hypothetical protein
MNGDWRIRHVHDAILLSAGLAPQIVSGAIRVAGIDSKDEQAGWVDFFEAQGWAARFAMAQILVMDILCWFAQPFALRRISNGIMSVVVLCFCSQSDGTVRLVFEPSTAVDRVVVPDVSKVRQLIPA